MKTATLNESFLSLTPQVEKKKKTVVSGASSFCQLATYSTNKRNETNLVKVRG
jgi:hypothetical protein